MGLLKHHRAAMAGIAFCGIALVVSLMLAHCRGGASPRVSDGTLVPAPAPAGEDAASPGREGNPPAKRGAEGPGKEGDVPQREEAKPAEAEVHVRMTAFDRRPLATPICVTALGNARTLEEAREARLHAGFLYDEDTPGYGGTEPTFTFRVRTGPQRIYFLPYEDEGLAITYVDIDAAEGKPNEVLVVLAKDHCVAGQLVDITGRPIANTSVFAEYPVENTGRRTRMDSVRLRNCEVHLGRGEVRVVTDTDREGRFRFRGLPVAAVKLEWSVGKEQWTEAWASGESNRLVVPEMVEPPEPLPFEKDSEQD